MDGFKLFEIHFGGHFEMNESLYVGGSIKIVDDIDIDNSSFEVLTNICKHYGWTTSSKIYYRIPGKVLSNGRKLISSDVNVQEMICWYNGLPAMLLYICSEGVEGDEGVQGDEGVEGDEGVQGYEGVEGVEGDEGDEDKQSSDPSWFNEGLEGVEDEDIFHIQGSRSNAKAQMEELLDDVEEWLSQVGKDDELLSYGSSDDDVDHFPEFNEDVDMKDPKLLVGMKFATTQVFREALREWSVRNGYDIKWIKNDNKRITACCPHEKCPFRIHASPMQGEKTFQIKTLNPKHTCGRTFYNSKVTSTYLSRKYFEKFVDEPNVSMTALQKTVKRELAVEVFVMKLYRARRKALDSIEGDYRKQYKSLWNYIATVKKYNPGSVLFLKTEIPQPGLLPHFQRIYVRLSAQKEGFTKGCRPIIGVDGCFLKGIFGGQILSACGRDGNDNMYPIALAVVEGETKDSWMWFLNAFIEDIGTDEKFGWTIISDRQKGLVDAIEVLMPNAEHRFCLRHMYNNFRVKYKGKQLKDIFWKAASCGTVREFTLHMETMKNVDKHAFAWLKKFEPNLWSRSHFRTSCKSDVLVNNISESFNKYILDARDKPILQMLEWIRRKIMGRIQVKKAGMEKYNDSICPSIKDKLEVAKDESRHCFAVWANTLKFEVDCFNTTYCVDLDARTCGCRLWDLTGIPCKHAVSCIVLTRDDPINYVHFYYSKTTYLKAYSHSLNPLPGQHDWEEADGGPILPPPYRRQPGRPRKLRIREPDEPRHEGKVSRKNKYVTCAKCLQPGHNQRSCKGPVHPSNKFLRKRAASSNQGIGEARVVMPKRKKPNENVTPSSLAATEHAPMSSQVTIAGSSQATKTRDKTPSQELIMKLLLRGGKGAVNQTETATSQASRGAVKETIKQTEAHQNQSSSGAIGTRGTQLLNASGLGIEAVRGNVDKGKKVVVAKGNEVVKRTT